MKAISACIGDIHFNINTISLASKATRAALLKAEELGIPLLICGDLNDTKALIRGEVANELIDIFQNAKTQVYVIIGNHDLISEKGKEHSLNFLRPYVQIVDEITFLDEIQAWLIPYQTDTTYLKTLLPTFTPGSQLIMHQGFLGAEMGEYIQDRSSIDPVLFKDFNVISSHYHKHQTLGTVTYIGSPYSISFSEAHDPAKGFLILNSDGSFTREILSLRKHTLLERDVSKVNVPIENYKTGDLLWLKVTGPESELNKIDKKQLGMLLIGHNNYKLDKIVTEVDTPVLEIGSLSEGEVLDLIIDELPETPDQKQVLKQLWRDL